MTKNLKRNWLVFQNWHKEFDEFCPKHSKVSKIYTLIGCFSPKYIMFERKKYRGVIFHDTEDWCKIWRKTELWFGKWHEEFGKFSPEHSKFSELGLWWDPFIQIKKCMSLTFTGELCVMTMKIDAKFEEELTCQFKIDMRNLTNFDQSTQKYKESHFNEPFLTKLHNVWAKKSTEELCLMRLKINAKFEGKLTCACKELKNLANFHRLKNSNFILESKMAELNQNKNSYITTRSTRCSVKLYFTLEINE